MHVHFRSVNFFVLQEAERERSDGVERSRDDRIHLMEFNTADLEGK